MRWEAAWFSVKLAWNRPVLRWLTLGTWFLVLTASLLYLLSVVPMARKDGLFILHYNVYFGADEVRAWSWSFFPPLLWTVVTGICTAWAYVVYQRDMSAAVGLLISSFMWSLPWVGALLYLSIINQS